MPEQLVKLFEEYDAQNKVIQEKSLCMLMNELELADDKVEAYKNNLDYKYNLAMLNQDRKKRDKIFDKSKLRRTIIKGLPNDFLHFERVPIEQENKNNEVNYAYIALGPLKG